MLTPFVSTTLLICTRCRPAGGDADACRPGTVLLGEASRALASDDPVKVVGIACLSACRKACVAALMAPDKVGYLFGDIPPNADGAADLLAVAKAHAVASEGYLSRAQRPVRLQGGIIARLPPSHWMPQDPKAAIAWPR